MELDMRTMLGRLAIVTLAAIAGCSGSTEIADCGGAKTTASFRDAPANSARITNITMSGQSTIVDVDWDVTPSSRSTVIVADTTAVFERFGERTPRPSSSCRLAVGETVEILLGDGFGDFNGDMPAPTLHQVVIDR
jgi:hypothetical protein